MKDQEEYPPEIKVKTVIKGLQDPEGIAAYCQRIGITEDTFIEWRKQILEQSDELFDRSSQTTSPKNDSVKWKILIPLISLVIALCAFLYTIHINNIKSKYEAEIVISNGKLDEYEKNLNNLKSEYEAEIERSNAKLDDYEKKLHDIKSINNGLNKRIIYLNTRLDSIKKLYVSVKEPDEISIPKFNVKLKLPDAVRLLTYNVYIDGENRNKGLNFHLLKGKHSIRIEYLDELNENHTWKDVIDLKIDQIITVNMNEFK